MNFKQSIKISIKLIIVAVVIFCLIYPLLVGGIGQIWQNSVKGSIIEYKGEKVGSRIIGQHFNSPEYFHSRPSSINYDARKSASANLAPNNPELTERINDELSEMTGLEEIDKQVIPADLVTESASALDPHISPEAALLQVPRIAEATGISPGKLRSIVKKRIQSKFMGIFGMERVNVLELNLIIEEEMNI